MKLVFLKFSDEAEFISACETAGLTTVIDGETFVVENKHKAYQMIRLGSLYKETGNTLSDEDGNTYPEMEALKGYHVNLLTNDLSLLADYQITVDTPLVQVSGHYL